MKTIKVTDEQYSKLIDIMDDYGENEHYDTFDTVIDVLLQNYNMNLHTNITNLVYCLTNYKKDKAIKEFEIL